MATLPLTAANLADVVETDGVVVIEFWANWCGPCRRFAPIYERVSERHPDVIFARVDTEAEPELAAAFDIMSIPMLMVIRKRTVLYARPGALTMQALEQLVARAKARDMNPARPAG